MKARVALALGLGCALSALPAAAQAPAPAGKGLVKGQSRKAQRSTAVAAAQQQVAAPEPTPPPAEPTAAELEIAARVHQGHIACAFGAFVTVTADPASAGYFQVEGRGFKYRMVPVPTSTGAVRLEDRSGGAVWLQVASKSMLMNQRLGQRLADDCMHPEQLQAAQALQQNPPPSLLEPPLAAAPATAP